MKIKTKEIKYVELDTEETKFFITMLNYAWHRAVKHKTQMTQFTPKIEQMRRELGIIKID